MKKKQATSSNCFVCGRDNSTGLHLNFYMSPAGQVTAEICIPDRYQGYPGIVHGGVVAAILDEAGGRAFLDGDPPRFMYTSQLSIRYRKPVPTGIDLRVIGTAGKDYGRVAKATSQIQDAMGTVLAEAEGTYVNLPPQDVEGVDYAALGWKVVSDEEELA